MSASEIGAAEVLAAVRDIVPTLRDNGRKTEDQRWLVADNLELLEKAGVFRIAVPKKFGGLDLPVADQAEILSEISRGCGSTGWVSMVWISTAWIASLYPDKAQEEIYAEGSVRISGGFTPGGTLKPVEGGYLLNGTWRFNTGIRGAQWNVHAALVEHENGEHEELFAMVPTSDIEIADDWDVFGASGTGSATSTAKDVFVPAHRIVGVDVYDASTRDRWNADLKGRNYNLTSYIVATCAPVYLGLAKAALELYLERTPGKPMSYSNWADQAEHPYIQVQVGHAANKIAACEAFQKVWLENIQRAADAGEKMTTEEKAAVRGQVGYVVQATKEAVDTLFGVSSASAILRSTPFQRSFRDIAALSLHGLMTPIGSLEAHGRVLLGLEPGTDYL
ncbi:acyl-CoA dehydrogenase family protein [Streptomyces sp. UNOB3_S3]|uniref:acyl-CoA dehydrogenase family protein n=1 Tax=Streptomyces sp. UNOB3_S3 TaxID=2871682 RepID=UPI001E403F2A|nr:acyl-CoA dehydrogenase family protein [Streptomyces sp. UNOB3_S3]MCC3777916.1 acyl-CoA dehydrogenase family protein [Streptomyces sp. UNOB3_S3]